MTVSKMFFRILNGSSFSGVVPESQNVVQEYVNTLSARKERKMVKQTYGADLTAARPKSELRIYVTTIYWESDQFVLL